MAAASTDVGQLTVKVKLLVTLTEELADLEGSAALFAVTVKLGGTGRTCGAVKSPLALTVPQVVPMQPGPVTLQLTAWLGLPEPLTLARYCRAAPSSTSAAPGVKVMATSLAMFTVAAALFELSAWLEAWMLIVVCAGSTWGAVNKPVESIVPQAAPPQLGPETLQITTVLLEPVTVALNCRRAPRKTVAEDGMTLTLMPGGGGAGTIAPPPPHPSVRAPQARIADAWGTAKRTLVRPAYCLFATQHTRGPASKDWATPEWWRGLTGKADEFARLSEQLGLLKMWCSAKLAGCLCDPGEVLEPTKKAAEQQFSPQEAVPNRNGKTGVSVSKWHR